jgi:CRISPR-associated protein Cmr1
MVGSQLYLGFGPLVIKRVTALKANAAIQADESARLSIALTDDAANAFAAVLALVNLYGTVGGRSRNGWGSFVLKPLNDTPSLPEESKAFQRRWREALQLDWPHAIGADDDGRPLIWRTEEPRDWQQVMKRLAEIKIGLRTQFKPGANGAHVPEERHWLSYPITHHSVKSWGNARLPNSLRFKVRPAQNGSVHGVIFHVPCLPPADFRPDRRVIESVWQRVHQFLDAPAQKLSRISA